MPDGQRPHGLLLRVGPGQLVLLPDQIAQDAVAHPRQTVHAQLAAQLHAGVGGGAFRDAVLQQNLARAKAQDVAQLDVGIRLGHHLAQGMVDGQQMLQRIIHQAGYQTAVGGVQPALYQLFIQRKGSVCAAFRHLTDHRQRHAPGRQALHGDSLLFQLPVSTGIRLSVSKRSLIPTRSVVSMEKPSFIPTMCGFPARRPRLSVPTSHICPTFCLLVSMTWTFISTRQAFITA